MGWRAECERAKEGGSGGWAACRKGCVVRIGSVKACGQEAVSGAVLAACD